MDSFGNIEELTGAASLVNDPPKSSEGGYGSCDKFNHEKISESSWRNQKQRQLNDPKEEVRYHPICRDTLIFRNGVRNAVVTWPD